MDVWLSSIGARQAPWKRTFRSGSEVVSTQQPGMDAPVRPLTGPSGHLRTGRTAISGPRVRRVSSAGATNNGNKHSLRPRCRRRHARGAKCLLERYMRLWENLPCVALYLSTRPLTDLARLRAPVSPSVHALHQFAALGVNLNPSPPTFQSCTSTSACRLGRACLVPTLEHDTISRSSVSDSIHSHISPQRLPSSEARPPRFSPGSASSHD